MRKSRISQIILRVIAFILLLFVIVIGNENTGLENKVKSFFYGFVEPFEKYKQNKENINLAELSKKDLKEIEKENIEIKEELEKAKAEVNKIEFLKQSINELNEVLGLKSAYTNYETLPAKVVNKTKNGINSYVKINVGEKEGIKEGMTIIYSGGIYGRVFKVFENHSEAQLITDVSSKISVKVGDAKESVILKGDIENSLKLTLIPLDMNILKDTEIYTSGEGGIILPGIYVGKVKEVVIPKNKKDMHATIETRDDIYKVNNVLVLKQKI